MIANRSMTRIWSEPSAAERRSAASIVCAGTGCVASGAYERLPGLRGADPGGRHHRSSTEFKAGRHGHDLRLNKSGCQGFCQMGPLVTVQPDGILYTQGQGGGRCRDRRRDARGPGRLVERLLYVDPGDASKRCRGTDRDSFLPTPAAVRAARSAARIDPEDIEEYIHHGGYAAARKAFLRDDAGADLPGDHASRACAAAAAAGSPPAGNGRRPGRSRAPKKYVICNADEGDPGRVHGPQRDGRQSRTA